MAKRRYFTVDLRCGTCGNIFCATREPVEAHKVPEYKAKFLAVGPTRYQQCKRKCPTEKQNVLSKDVIIGVATGLPGNQNLQVVVAEYFPELHPN